MKTLVKIVWLVLLAALVAVFGYRSYLKIAELQTLREKQMAYEERIRELEYRVASLARQIEDIHSDPSRLEEVAREKLGWVGKDETIFVIEEDPTPPQE